MMSEDREARPPVLNEQKQISITGVFAGRRDHCVSLPAMMRLMIEEMGNQKSPR